MGNKWNIRKFSKKRPGTSRKIGAVIANTDRQAERKGAKKFKLKEEQIFALRKDTKKSKSSKKSGRGR